MRKVQAEALESISDYRIVDAEVPRPGRGEILVKVAACGVGYVDALVSLGRYQVKPSLPHTPGQDVSGWVDDASDGVADLEVGDRVMATVRGGFAEFVIVPATSAVKIPGRMEFGAAAAFRMNYLTALHGLRDRGNVKSGETVVVLGAAGGLGAAAVQVAKVLGARVIAVASTEEKRAFCKSLGADETLSATPEGWRDRLKAVGGGAGPDVVFDPVCGPLFEPAFRALAWGGRHLVLGFVGGPIPALRANLPLMKGAALIGVDVRQFGLFEPDRAAAHLTELLGWVSEGRITPPVGRTFELDEFAEALGFALSGQGLGKTIVRLGEP